MLFTSSVPSVFFPTTDFLDSSWWRWDERSTSLCFCTGTLSCAHCARNLQSLGNKWANKAIIDNHCFSVYHFETIIFKINKSGSGWVIISLWFINFHWNQNYMMAYQVIVSLNYTNNNKKQSEWDLFYFSEAEVQLLLVWLSDLMLTCFLLCSDVPGSPSSLSVPKEEWLC